jgi:hypothetical protein
MAACVPMCQWKFLSNDGTTMAATEAESHGGAPLCPSNSAIMLGEGSEGVAGPIHLGHTCLGASAPVPEPGKPCCPHSET